MPVPRYEVVRIDETYDLTAFDCGNDPYNVWLSEHAASSVRAGVCAVYLLVERHEGETSVGRVVGYYAISPTQVVRSDVPARRSRGWPQAVPGWMIGKLAVDTSLRQDKHAQWDRQLLRSAIETVLRACDVGGGKVIVVDAEDPSLLSFYLANGFRSTGVEGDLTCYLKVSTARALLRS